MISTGAEPLAFVLKLAAVCNLNCSYCYVYNKGDDSWRRRPAFMSAVLVEAAAARIRAHAQLSGQRKVRIIFHGGEPCLIGAEAFELICRRLRTALGDIGHIHFALQTNGTLLTPDWIRVLRTQGIVVGVSLDASREIHDRDRVAHGGRPSYDGIVEGLRHMTASAAVFDLLSVIPLGGDGAAAYRNLASLGPRSIDFLLPDYTHDDIAIVRERYGPTPCADFLIPAFEEWWSSGAIDLRIGLFWSMTRVILGAESDVDLLGNQPLRFVFVETDGEIQPLDVLRVCGPNFNGTPLNVLDHDFCELAQANPTLAQTVFGGMPLASGCAGCAERETCAGGYLPHRFSRARGFDNPSVWCADLLALFTHMRSRLDVGVGETARLRHEAAAEGGPRDLVEARP